MIDISHNRRQGRCNARTRNGHRCRAGAMPNGRCRMHGGASTGPRTDAGKLASLDALARGREAAGRRRYVIRVAKRLALAVPVQIQRGYDAEKLIRETRVAVAKNLAKMWAGESEIVKLMAVFEAEFEAERGRK